MALGTNYNNNKKSSGTELTVYSNYRVTNTQSEVDKTSLSFYHWNGMLAISLCPAIPNANDDTIKFDRDNAITIYLSVFKAALLSREIEKFNMGDATNVGVSTRSGIITITTGEEFGSTSPVLIIRKIDENGNILSSYAYEIRKNYHYAINNFTESASGGVESFEKKFYDDIELDLIKMQLDEYVRSMTMSVAYSCQSAAMRRDNRLEYKINEIAKALHVEFGNGSSGGNGGFKSSYFDAAEGNSNLIGSNDDFE